MPFKSKKQARLFQAAAHNKIFAKKVNIPQTIAKKFIEDDKNEGKAKKGRKN
jgi:hypothetical protein